MNITSMNQFNKNTLNNKLNNAKIARDNAIRIIQNNEDKINKINAQIKRISIYITIFSTILSVADLALTIIPLPIPPNIIKILLKIIEKVNKILIALSALIPITINVLDKSISILEDYKSQLLDINGQLESAAATNNNLSSTSGGNFTFGSTSDEYKGFKFAIREDTSFGGVTVGGFKRHYAVAIDKFNVDVLKSEYSFTLDPNDLISQLKLVIDQQNLQA
jgi:hypothetical protein